ncbi:hypothetical protein E4V60_17960, partial [Proteus mirabilis]
MNDEHKIFEKIKASLNRASFIIDLRSKIEDKISAVVKKLEVITNNKVKVSFEDNNKSIIHLVSSKQHKTVIAKAVPVFLLVINQ